MDSGAFLKPVWISESSKFWNLTPVTQKPRFSKLQNTWVFRSSESLEFPESLLFWPSEYFSSLSKSSFLRSTFSGNTQSIDSSRYTNTTTTDSPELPSRWASPLIGTSSSDHSPLSYHLSLPHALTLSGQLLARRLLSAARHDTDSSDALGYASDGAVVCAPLTTPLSPRRTRDYATDRYESQLGPRGTSFLFVSNCSFSVFAENLSARLAFSNPLPWSNMYAFLRSHYSKIASYHLFSYQRRLINHGPLLLLISATTNVQFLSKPPVHLDNRRFRNWLPL